MRQAKDPSNSDLLGVVSRKNSQASSDKVEESETLAALKNIRKKIQEHNMQIKRKSRGAQRKHAVPLDYDPTLERKVIKAHYTATNHKLLSTDG